MSKIGEYFNSFLNGLNSDKNPPYKLVFIDTEVGVDKKIHDIGALKDQLEFHNNSLEKFINFIDDCEYVCGHNVIQHDIKYISKHFNKINRKKIIDTLYLSPLLFPQKPYHHLVKDYKLVSEEINNPLLDCRITKDLFFDEVNAFYNLPDELRAIYYELLHSSKEFSVFFNYLEYKAEINDLESFIFNTFKENICSHSSLRKLISKQPIELAYALAIINTGDSHSLTPSWLLVNYPNIENIIRILCGKPCDDENCIHCNNKLNINKGLKKFFNYDEFRSFDGEPLQEKAVKAAMDGKSIITIFPTGGGKSLTFQLPAIMAGNATHGLTVIISPLQSLMKDQVDNLYEKGITDAVTINGLLDPIERADSIERVVDGNATLLYISPEMLRSKTIEKLLLSRTIVRFVIDEAHCFSAWGQDFRVDYLYIGRFIKQLQNKKNLLEPIPVSCFTATAKPKVISDIADYFKRELELDLQIFATTESRKNLRYFVQYAETEGEKFNLARNLILNYDCPSIVYASRTKKAEELAHKLTIDGIQALPYHGKMPSETKIENQNLFMNNTVQVMVATSAFGMGVDKSDVGLIVHYDISNSLENYIQEAGRAGRDPSTDAACFVLYSDHDLDKHFSLLNQTKVSISEIQQIWKAIKDFTKQRKKVYCSALEIARQAGWGDDVTDVETRVRTAISVLEESGFVSRGNNSPRVFATGILVKNLDEARQKIENSKLFQSEVERTNAIRIIQRLISERSKKISNDEEAESRVDYLADLLAIEKKEVLHCVNIMRQDKILADTKDMTAFLLLSKQKTEQLLDNFAKLELFLLKTFSEIDSYITIKELNQRASEFNIQASVKNLKTILNFLNVKKYIIIADHQNDMICTSIASDPDKLFERCQNRFFICKTIISKLFSQTNTANNQNGTYVEFSIISILEDLNDNKDIFNANKKYSISEVEESLLYLSKIGALKLEGGFLVLYNAMEVNRLKELKFKYTKENYRILDEFYKQKQQQIHIVGEYANMMVQDYDAALRYVQDYFLLDYKKFISKYFKGERLKEISRNISPKKYKQIFDSLSKKQLEIINDNQSKFIVVAAGPGSGKTRVLVHKLASLLLMEDVKQEQLLMLTFSRAAATEFKQRLIDLIGNAAYFVDIQTFHAFCFKLLGKIGNLDEAEGVIKRATELILNGEVEQAMISKNVLVIDEAQDMSDDEFSLVQALISQNEEMRVIAVGDDDQNIYEFRNSSSKYMLSLINNFNATRYEMTENYRSCAEIVNLANIFIQKLPSRIKFTPNIALNQKKGFVNITKHTSANLEIPLVDNIIKTYKNGSACVLTGTNETAACIVRLLQLHNINAKLIQTNDGFKFYDLAEVRYFIKKIQQQTKTPIIDENIWLKSKENTLSIYKTSRCIEYVIEFWNIFEKTNNIKYIGSLLDFASESNIDDFIKQDQKTIFVSTIHKSKGREFDTVYMLLNNEQCNTAENIRKIYVGITRAKNNLYIHCNTDIFDNFKLEKNCSHYDNKRYPAPNEIIEQLSHKDVVLDFFKDKKNAILQLRSGTPLMHSDEYLSYNGIKLVKFSKKKRDEIESWKKKGYHIVFAKINYIVAWKDKEDKQEYAVILPEILLTQLSPSLPFLPL